MDPSLKTNVTFNLIFKYHLDKWMNECNENRKIHFYACSELQISYADVPRVNHFI